MVEPEALTVQQAARILSVSEDTVRRMIDGGELPAFKVRRRWRIKREEVDNLMRGQK